MNKFAVPSLRVGSLDTLMSLSDELARADSFCESVVKKAERAVSETYIAQKQNEAAKAGAAAPNIPPLGYYCCGKSVVRYVESFQWDAAKWDTSDALPDLLKKLLEAAEKTDADLRSLMQAYSDKKTAWVAADRKRRCVRPRVCARARERRLCTPPPLTPYSPPHPHHPHPSTPGTARARAPQRQFPCLAADGRDHAARAAGSGRGVGIRGL